MRFSQVIDDFLNIKLSKFDQNRIDALFVGASHHRYRAFRSVKQRDRIFHTFFYFRHVFAFMTIISRGDFKNIFTGSKTIIERHLHKKEGWMPDRRFPNILSIPHFLEWWDGFLPWPDMFDEMLPDVRWRDGEHHPYDVLLDNYEIRPHDIYLDEIRSA